MAVPKIDVYHSFFGENAGEWMRLQQLLTMSFVTRFFHSCSQRQVPADISNGIYVRKRLIVDEKFSQFILITEIYPSAEKSIS